MRSRILAFPFAVVLALGLAAPAAADTAPGGDGAEGGLDVAITSIDINPRSGLVTVSGEVTCEVDFDWIGASVELSQVVGRLFTIRGWGGADAGGCAAADGAAPFTMSFTADSGRFAPGKAQVRVEAWGEGGCSADPETGDYTCATWGWAAHGPLPVRLHAAR